MSSKFHEGQQFCPFLVLFGGYNFSYCPFQRLKMSGHSVLVSNYIISQKVSENPKDLLQYYNVLFNYKLHARKGWFEFYICHCQVADSAFNFFLFLSKACQLLLLFVFFTKSFHAGMIVKVSRDTWMTSLL